MQMKPEQLEIIKEQFKTLKDRSAFYARKFKDIDLSDVQTQEDFEKLPFSEKADLREAYPLGLQAVPDEKIIRIHSSSGTTGQNSNELSSNRVPKPMSRAWWAGSRRSIGRQAVRSRELRYSSGLVEG